MSNISLINKVKYNPAIYRLYKRVGSLFINLFKLFIIPDDHLILFVCFGGRRYDDSPRCIYEAMLEDHRFDGYQLVWAFINPSNHILKGRGKIIKIDTLNYCYTALKARIWVTNSNVDRGLSFKGKHTFYFNTWHGSSIKKLGADMNSLSFANASDIKNNKTDTIFDVFCAQSDYDISVFSSAFNIPKDRFKIIGLPRNDELVSNNNQTVIESIKEKINLPKDKTIILYAPTFREFNRDDGNNCVLTPPMNLEKWEKELGDQYILLFRAHYEIVKHLDIPDNQFIRNYSSYPNLNELLLITDICISDYSSILFDFSILGRPMICWAYDFDEYCEKRGLYFNIRKTLQNEGIKTEDDVISSIKEMNVQERIFITNCFRERYLTENGEATKKSLDIIAAALDN